MYDISHTHTHTHTHTNTHTHMSKDMQRRTQRAQEIKCVWGGWEGGSDTWRNTCEVEMCFIKKKGFYFNWITLLHWRRCICTKHILVRDICIGLWEICIGSWHTRVISIGSHSCTPGAVNLHKHVLVLDICIGSCEVYISSWHISWDIHIGSWHIHWFMMYVLVCDIMHWFVRHMYWFVRNIYWFVTNLESRSWTHFLVRSFEWRGLCLHTWKFQWKCTHVKISMQIWGLPEKHVWCV